MIYSMTGYGKTEFEVNRKKITIEIKSLNSRQLDINSRLPVSYKEKDIQFRKDISERLVRGKIDLFIHVENLGEETCSNINEVIVKKYFSQVSSINDQLGLPVNEEIMKSILHLPDTVKVTYKDLDEEEWMEIHKHFQRVMDDLIAFREQEGKALEEDISGNISKIAGLLPHITPHEKQRIEAIKKRLHDAFEKFADNGKFDKNRFEQELIFYLEKFDINEEKVRLTNHCNYFNDTLKSEIQVGKKLGFIAQEIGREINTIGSKANDSDIQRIVVQMKDHLERVKEQLLNVL